MSAICWSSVMTWHNKLFVWCSNTYIKEKDKIQGAFAIARDLAEKVRDAKKAEKAKAAE